MKHREKRENFPTDLDVYKTLPNPELSANQKGFLEDYKKLCHKWNCLIVSEGEDIDIMEVEDMSYYSTYWGLEDTTIEKIKWDKAREQAKIKRNSK